MHDRAPVYFARDVRECSDKQIPRDGLVYGSNILRSARSPNLNSLNFIIRAFIKQEVNITTLTKSETE